MRHSNRHLIQDDELVIDWASARLLLLSSHLIPHLCRRDVAYHLHILTLSKSYRLCLRYIVRRSQYTQWWHFTIRLANDTFFALKITCNLILWKHKSFFFASMYNIGFQVTITSFLFKFCKYFIRFYRSVLNYQI